MHQEEIMTRPYLGNPKYTIEVLQKYGFVFQNSYFERYFERVG